MCKKRSVCKNRSACKPSACVNRSLCRYASVEDFVLPFKCNRVLRPYQQEGVNWLAFLRRFKLHGALCDDMGLGKTLQSTCILAATIVERREAGLPFLPALVVCPPTLVGHWAHEISQYVGEDVLNPLGRVACVALNFAHWSAPYV
jgi:TATA-binding protein-associated factor